MNIKNAKELINLGLIEKDSDISWIVDEETVLLRQEKSFSYLSCSCVSCSLSNNKSLCQHKLAVLLFESQDFKLKKLIRENLKLAEQHKKLGMKIDASIFENLLNDLKSFI